MEAKSSKWQLFRPSRGMAENVNLDWLKDSTPYAMAEAFKESADLTVAHSEESPSHADAYFFPAAFLYRHSIELLLKLILQSGSELRPPPLCLTQGKGHSLERLWKDVLEVIMTVYPNDDRTLLTEYAAILFELDAADPDGQSFRYHRNLKGDINLSNLPRTFSLDNLQAGVSRLFDFLNGCLCGLDEALTWQAEMASQYGPDW